MKHISSGGVVRFLTDVLKGVAIGCAFIVPGFSGGTVAALLGVYERLVGAVSGIFTSFKKSVAVLFPIALGMVLGVVALLFPIRWAMENYPLPAVGLFAGLSIGGIPVVAGKAGGKFRPLDLLPLVLAFAAAFGMAFLPKGAEAELGQITFGGGVVLFLVGVVGSFALVVPGISGSMLLLLLGFYNPLLGLVTGLLSGETSASAVAALCCVGVGIVVGFFLVSVLMKKLLEKFPRTTYLCILGFILGSLPAVFTGLPNESASLGVWAVTACMIALGAAVSLLLFKLTRKRTEK